MQVLVSFIPNYIFDYFFSFIYNLSLQLIAIKCSDPVLNGRPAVSEATLCPLFQSHCPVDEELTQCKSYQHYFRTEFRQTKFEQFIDIVKIDISVLNVYDGQSSSSSSQQTTEKYFRRNCRIKFLTPIHSLFDCRFTLLQQGHKRLFFLSYLVAFLCCCCCAVLKHALYTEETISTLK